MVCERQASIIVDIWSLKLKYLESGEAFLSCPQLLSSRDLARASHHDLRRRRLRFHWGRQTGRQRAAR